MPRHQPASKIQISYFTFGNQNPVKSFLDSLNTRQQAKVLRLFLTIQLYGLSSVSRHIKKLTGTPLWELRLLGQDNLRFLYFLPTQTSIVLLHGFIKKTQKTPPKTINLAINRYRIWHSRKNIDK